MALTKREAAVAERVGLGLTTKAIAGDLRISSRRVRMLITSIAYKIGARPDRDERVQVAEWWRAGSSFRYTDSE